MKEVERPYHDAESDSLGLWTASGLDRQDV